MAIYRDSYRNADAPEKVFISIDIFSLKININIAGNKAISILKIENVLNSFNPFRIANIVKFITVDHINGIEKYIRNLKLGSLKI